MANLPWVMARACAHLACATVGRFGGRAQAAPCGGNCGKCWMRLILRRIRRSASLAGGRRHRDMARNRFRACGGQFRGSRDARSDGVRMPVEVVIIKNVAGCQAVWHGGWAGSAVKMGNHAANSRAAGGDQFQSAFMAWPSGAGSSASSARRGRGRPSSAGSTPAGWRGSAPHAASNRRDSARAGAS